MLLLHVFLKLLRTKKEVWRLHAYCIDRKLWKICSLCDSLFCRYSVDPFRPVVYSALSVLVSVNPPCGSGNTDGRKGVLYSAGWASGLQRWAQSAAISWFDFFYRSTLSIIDRHQKWFCRFIVLRFGFGWHVKLLIRKLMDVVECATLKKFCIAAISLAFALIKNSRVCWRTR